MGEEIGERPGKGEEIGNDQVWGYNMDNAMNNKQVRLNGNIQSDH